MEFSSEKIPGPCYVIRIARDYYAISSLCYHVIYSVR
jgi:hypothetical protein